MDEVPPTPEAVPEPPAPEPEPPPRKRGWAALAWLVILAVVGVIVWGRSVPDRGGDPEREDRLSLVVFELQARYLVGAADFMGRTTAYQQAQPFNRGALPQRMRFIALAGELGGPAAAISELEQLDKLLAEHRDRARMTPEQDRARAALAALYQDYADLKVDAPSVGPEDRALIRRELEWFGDLALAYRGVAVPRAPFVAAAGPALAAALGPALDPERIARREEVLEPAERTFATLLGSVCAGVFLGLCGFVGLILLIVLAATGTAKGGVQTGSPHGGVYAETFALWMVLFVGLSVLASSLPAEWGGIPLTGGAMLLSLGVLAWPVLRGVPWRQVRADVGLTAGRSPALEPLLGVAAYVMSLPLLALGFIVTLFLMSLQREVSTLEGDPFAPAGGPAHPIIGPLADGDWGVRLQILFLASVVAPIVEETMFRGVLYRHLREASGKLGTVVSLLLSGAVVSFIFAVIHPQGLVAVPVLMGLALGFTVAREWRGSLVPCMVAHGVNNGLVTLLAIVALGKS